MCIVWLIFMRGEVVGYSLLYMNTLTLFREAALDPLGFGTKMTVRSACFQKYHCRPRVSSPRLAVAV